ncbi:hypothetical protein SLEP1_g46155 [Rubroshorea leprosula]|uniref:CRIB domain-containing protein n=1 Tax=Rubroshorea leprosula TaxID=152421 RepID=A0AAV5LM81_9ROSI|nr:hypothetical protein SLEP1_g46155 [Rubroshorea leprosula]
MATKIRRIYKRFKYICQIFVVKEREMEIGYPTDVKHVAHIGWDGASGTPPSWMSEFKPGPDFNTSLGANPRDSNSEATNPLSPQDYDWPEGSQKCIDSPSSTNVSNPTKKQKRRKKFATSLRSNSSKSSRISSKSKYSQMEPTSNL